MRWQSPKEYAEEKIVKPIQNANLIAYAAFGLAVFALFIAMRAGKR